VPTPNLPAVVAVQPELSPEQSEGLYKTWMQHIDDALKREKKYREKAQKVVDLYEAKNADESPFAIVYSNTEVLVPALYNARPIPMVTRRFKDADPIGKAAAEVSTRTLKFLVDTECENYDGFDDLMQACVLDAVVTNRGLTRFKYVPNSTMPECVYGEAVRWDKFFHGYARTWKKVPWVGFEWDMSKAEMQRNFQGIPLDFKNTSGLDDENSSDHSESREERTGVQTWKVYEIWDKDTRKVMFFSAVYGKGPLRMVDDPLGLSSFFPVPRPLNFMRKISTLVPTPLYEHYRQQAQELNDITRRLKAIIKAIKFRGAYNSAVEGIERMLKADDNELVPVENVQSMPDGTGMDKLLWIVPVAELAQTAQNLYQQRESVKQVIYEITGISDILRGASVASETATAQNIKNQWGTLRLKKMQKEVQRYCRDALAIMLEIAAGKFEIETLQAMTGLPFMKQADKQLLTQQMQQAQAGAQASGQQLPPPPPALQEALNHPTWEQVVGLLHNQVSLHYKADIETNSTIDAEAAQDKQDISELLNALSQFLNGLGPMIEKGILPFELAKQMLLVITRRYNFGSQLEDMLLGMTTPPPTPDANADPAKQAQAQADIAKAQLDMQKSKQDAMLSQQEFEQKKQLMQLQLQIEQAELEIKQKELQMQQQALDMKLQAQQAQHAMKMEALRSKAVEPSHAPV